MKFQGGKDSRDILGSYYTQEEFAYEITQKAIEEFLDNNQEEIKELKIARAHTRLSDFTRSSSLSSKRERT